MAAAVAAGVTVIFGSPYGGMKCINLNLIAFRNNI